MIRGTAHITATVALAWVAQARADTSLFASMPVLDVRPTWQLVIGASLVALLVGFVLGWRVLDRRIRKKYGGLKIY